MTVAMGPKGNHFILGGKLSQLSAEDAYTVSLAQFYLAGHANQFVMLAPNYSCVRQRGSLRRSESRPHGTKKIRQVRSFNRKLPSLRPDDRRRNRELPRHRFSFHHLRPEGYQ